MARGYTDRAIAVLTGTAAILSEANFPSDAAHTAPEEKTDPMTMTESTPQTAPSAPPVAPAPAELLVSMTDAALRLFVKSGGCSGYSYGLAFDDKIADDDRVEDHAGVPIVIDAFSAQHVAGAEIDYVDSLMGSGFAINNPNAVSSCSCGQSFNTDGSPAKAGGCH